MVPAPVVAQVSRSPRQVQLRRLLRGGEVVSLTEQRAHSAGRLRRALRPLAAHTACSRRTPAPDRRHDLSTTSSAWASCDCRMSALREMKPGFQHLLGWWKPSFITMPGFAGKARLAIIWASVPRLPGGSYRALHRAGRCPAGGYVAHTIRHTPSDLRLQRVPRFDLTKGTSTPRVLLAPRGWTRKRQVPGSHQEVPLARASRCACRSPA